MVILKRKEKIDLNIKFHITVMASKPMKLWWPTAGYEDLGEGIVLRRSNGFVGLQGWPKG